MSESNKHKANFLLFVSTSEIRDKIKEIRKQIDIPERIFHDLDEKELDTLIEKWILEMATKTDEIESSPDFKNELQDIRERFKGGEITRKKAENLNHKLHLKLPINYLTNSIEEIVDKYDLPKFYESALRTYIITGRVVFMNKSSYGIKPNYFDNEKNNSISVTVYEPLTDENLKEIKERVNIHFKNRGPKNIKNIKDIELKLETEKEYLEREYVDPNNPDENFTSSAQQIADLINEEYGTNLNRNDVYDTSRQLEKLRKKRFGTK